MSIDVDMERNFYKVEPRNQKTERWEEIQTLVVPKRLGDLLENKDRTSKKNFLKQYKLKKAMIKESEK